MAAVAGRVAAGAPSVPMRSAQPIYKLLCDLLAVVADTLLPALMASVWEIALSAPTTWQRVRCLKQLRDSVVSTFNYYRKPILTRWLIEARTCLLERRAGEFSRL